MFVVESPDELLQQLEKTDITHPPFWRGATKDQLEHCLCFRFLSTFAEESQILFPLGVVQADKPDFRFEMNSSTTGVECTLALSEQFSRALALREECCPAVWIDLSDFRWGCPDRTSEEIIAILKRNKLTGEPWHGDAADREWARAMKACIDIKTEKLNADGFLRFGNNWLLIDDNFIPQSIIDIERCLPHLMPEMRKYFVAGHDSQIKFNEIMIRHKGDFVRLSSTTVDIKPINDLWQKHGN